MIFLVDSNPQLPNLRHKRILIVNNILISYEFWTQKEFEKLTSVRKEKFFNSLNVSIKKNVEPVKYEINSGYEIGFVVGKVISYLLIISIIIGSILLVRKLFRKKYKKLD